MSADIIGYARVSTDEQAEKGYGIENQVNRLEKIGDGGDYNLVDVIKDEGRSGTDLERPGLQKVLNLVKSGEIDCVAVVRLDRLSRDMLDTFHLLWILREHNVKVVVPK